MTPQGRAEKIVAPFRGRIIGGFGFVVHEWATDVGAEGLLLERIRAAIVEATNVEIERLAAREKDIAAAVGYLRCAELDMIDYAGEGSEPVSNLRAAMTALMPEAKVTL